ncbi:MAG: hypothetical protein AAFW73_07630 [Bacteroidota bacterium]
MKKFLYSTSAYLLASLLGISFYYALVQLFLFHFGLGLSLVSLLVFLVVVLIRDKDFIQEVEETP